MATNPMASSLLGTVSGKGEFNRVEDRFNPMKLKEGRDVRNLPGDGFDRGDPTRHQKPDG